MKKIFFLLFFFSLGFLSWAQDLTSFDFSLKDLNGDVQSLQGLLQAFREKAGTDKGMTIISFWAMWCEPCKQELKAMLPVYEKFEKKNLHYIAINLDTPRSLAKVKSYVKAQGFPYLMLSDPNSEVFSKLNGQSMPYSLMLKNTGVLLEKRVGFLPGDEKEIEKFLEKELE